MKKLLLIPLALLAGCSTSPKDFAVAPALSPPGSGLYQYEGYVQPVGYSAAPQRPRGNSLFTDRNVDYFRDTRAFDVGDIVTVKIKIDDEAKLDNNSQRSRNSGVNVGADYNATWNGAPIIGVLGGKLGLTGGTTAAGKGKVDRSEEIKLSVAAQVTQVLPNGNLFISGQQEMRVNYEVRVLSIAGVIRPGDIMPDNTIPYERIAEARISYGGRGRLSETQQPGWGQQALDQVLPY